MNDFPEVTQALIVDEVAAAYPTLPILFEAIERALWFGTLGKFCGDQAKAPEALASLTADLPDAEILSVLPAVYHDAWTEAHISSAAAETTGLPMPKGWAPT